MKKISYLLMALAMLLCSCHNVNSDLSNTDGPNDLSASTSGIDAPVIDSNEDVVTVLKEKGLNKPKIVKEANGRFQNGTSANELEYTILLVADYAYNDSLYHNTYIVLRTDDELELVDLEDEFGSYDDSITMCDINGDEIDECILQQVLDMFGGAGQFMSRVISFTEDEVNVIFESHPANLYDTGFRSEYLERKSLRITNVYTGYTTQIDISGMFKDEFFDSNGKGVNRPGIRCESFIVFEPKESNQDGYCEIECIQLVTLDGQSLGYARSILKYNSKTQTFDVTDSEFLTEDEYYQSLEGSTEDDSLC